jgi:molecular chaperone DnaK (HSP70)
MANLERVPAIGIDLGTTYSVVGIFRNNRVEILANFEGDFLIQNSIFFKILGSRLTPSCVSYMRNTLVGEAARKQLILSPTNTIYGNFNYLILMKIIYRVLKKSSIL